MELRLRRIALACLVTLGAIVVMVPGGGAANRTAEVSFDAFPGPARVTYGENIAYRATFTNVGNSTFTHVVFRMRVPFVAATGTQPSVEATPVGDTCPSTPVVINTANGPEWTCDFGQLGAGTAGTPQLVLTTVWKVPTLSLAGGCEDCLQTNGRWTINEGVNDITDPNDAFPPGGEPVTATLLAADTATLDSTNTTEAGGYETSLDPCNDPFGAGSLHTKQNPNAASNKVTTTVCLPSPIPFNEVDLGLATTILEGPSQPGDPGHQGLGRSTVCVATLGDNCDGTYTPHNFVTDDFGTDDPMILVFRIADDALTNGEKITQVFHNGVALPPCETADDCVVSIERSGGPVKVWIIVVKAASNGFYNW